MMSLKHIGKPLTLVIGTFFALASAQLYKYFFSDLIFGVVYLLSSFFIFVLICLVHCSFFEDGNRLSQYTQNKCFRIGSLLSLLVIIFTAKDVVSMLPGYYHDLYYYYLAVLVICLIVLTVHSDVKIKSVDGD